MRESWWSMITPGGGNGVWRQGKKSRGYVGRNACLLRAEGRAENRAGGREEAREVKGQEARVSMSEGSSSRQWPRSG